VVPWKAAMALHGIAHLEKDPEDGLNGGHIELPVAQNPKLAALLKELPDGGRRVFKGGIVLGKVSPSQLPDFSNSEIINAARAFNAAYSDAYEVTVQRAGSRLFLFDCLKNQPEEPPKKVGSFPASLAQETQVMSSEDTDHGEKPGSTSKVPVKRRPMTMDEARAAQGLPPLKPKVVEGGSAVAAGDKLKSHLNRR